MKTLPCGSALLTIVAVGILAGCAPISQSPDVSGDIRGLLDQAGLKQVSVKQDRDKGVVTLGGNVELDSDKARAEAIAKSNATGQVVSDQIAVLPKGEEDHARAMNSGVDKGIRQNMDAALLVNNLGDGVKYSVKNDVVTLRGEVDSQAKRQQAETVAVAVPNVKQVVDELQVKNQKATSPQ